MGVVYPSPHPHPTLMLSHPPCCPTTPEKGMLGSPIPSNSWCSIYDLSATISSTNVCLIVSEGTQIISCWRTRLYIHPTPSLHSSIASWWQIACLEYLMHIGGHSWTEAYPKLFLLPFMHVSIVLVKHCHLICGRIWEKGSYRAKHDFLLFFKLSLFQGHKSPRLPTWFVDSLGLLLNRSNIRR